MIAAWLALPASFAIINDGLFTHHGTIADLDMLKHVKQELSTVAGQKDTVTSSGSVVDLIRKINGLQRGGKIWDNTSHAEEHSLLGDALETEGVLDDFLKQTEN